MFVAPVHSQTLVFRLTVSDGDKTDEGVLRVVVSHKPIVASNFATANLFTRVFYESREDAFTGEVRTDVRMPGPNKALMLDAVCFDSGAAAVGFRLMGFDRPERDVDTPQELEVIWRLDEGSVERQVLPVRFIGDTPAVYFQSFEGDGFENSWPQVLGGGELAVRIQYRGVQEELFDLNVFGGTPVHLNLINCGQY